MTLFSVFPRSGRSQVCWQKQVLAGVVNAEGEVNDGEHVTVNFNRKPTEKASQPSLTCLGRSRTGWTGVNVRRRTRRIILVAIISVAIACTKEFTRDDAQGLVSEFGADTITSAIEPLRSLATSPKTELPQSKWPAAIRAMHPTNVFINEEGVWVAKRSGFIEGEGILIVFRGTKEPEEHWGDPSMWRVGRGVFWYQFTG